MEGELLALLDELRTTSELDAALAVVTRATAQLLGTERASLRLLDDTRARLLVAARAGASLHDTTTAPFVLGEGLVGWVAANATPLRVADATADPRFATRPDTLPSLGSFLGAPLRDEAGCFGVLATTSEHRDAFDEGDQTRLSLLASLAAPLLSVHRLRRLAQTDSLTRVLNRHALDEVLPSTSASPLAVAIVDVDHFKRINDEHGHAVGDETLRAIAREIVGAVRTDDRVLRLGGEEFLIVLAGASVEAARDRAERVRAQIAQGVRVQGEPVAVSIGVAARTAGETREALLARADAALYAAKQAGRDRVVSG